MERTNFYYLLVALLAFLVAIPLVDDLNVGGGPLVRALAFSGLLLIGVWSLKGGGRYFSIGMAFVIAGVILSMLTANLNSVFYQYGSLLSLIGFLFVAITYTLKQVAIGTDINPNRIAGAVCVYLLLGVIWAVTYSLLELSVPNSFAGFEAWSDRGWDSEWLYFSFVTITTLGYGDLLPISATARAMAYIQAILGQLYIAILVAGLVGAYIAQKDTSGR